MAGIHAIRCLEPSSSVDTNTETPTSTTCSVHPGNASLLTPLPQSSAATMSLSQFFNAVGIGRGCDEGGSRQRTEPGVSRHNVSCQDREVGRQDKAVACQDKAVACQDREVARQDKAVACQGQKCAAERPESVEGANREHEGADVEGGVQGEAAATMRVEEGSMPVQWHYLTWRSLPCSSQLPEDCPPSFRAFIEQLLETTLAPGFLPVMDGEKEKERERERGQDRGGRDKGEGGGSGAAEQCIVSQHSTESRPQQDKGRAMSGSAMMGAKEKRLYGERRGVNGEKERVALQEHVGEDVQQRKVGRWGNRGGVGERPSGEGGIVSSYCSEKVPILPSRKRQRHAECPTWGTVGSNGSAMEEQQQEAEDKEGKEEEEGEEREEEEREREQTGVETSNRRACERRMCEERRVTRQWNMWMGRSATSQLHFDALDNLHVCLQVRR